ncbi:hypothetical protein ACEPAI_1999 [Sanghuangporus weigelae]
MSLEVGLTSKTPYLDAVSTSLPSVLSDLLMSFDIFTRDKLDTLIRFCAGGACPTRIAGHANAWASGQSRLQQRLAALDPSTGEKRLRADDDENGAAGGSLTNGNGVANKKPKLAAAVEDGVHDTEPLFTLHSLSITAPIRKKVDISITSEAIRLTNPTNGNLEARVPLSILKRAFFVSNLGKNKNKEQWAVTLISADSYNKKGDAASQAQLAFNVDKIVPGGKDGFKTTAGSAQQESHAKGDETLPLLQAFLSHLPPHIEMYIADRGSQAFRSSSGQPYVDAYLGAKEGALCFLPQGILWANARPCEFYALEDLAPDSDTPGMGGVKTLSATGRTFSVFVRRKSIRSPDVGDEEGSDYDEAEEGEETEFAMIDGRESENVNAWIRKYRSQFGRPRDVKGKGKARADPQDEEAMQRNDDSDASDEDYAAPSESDGGEPSSDDESSNDDDGTQTVEDEEAEGTDEEGINDDDEDEDEEEEELDAARHPLLRPGAMPKMSKAAMEAAIAMVTQDTLGTKGGHADDEEDEGDDEEVDELE